jgi:HSP20 family protein
MEAVAPSADKADGSVCRLVAHVYLRNISLTGEGTAIKGKRLPIGKGQKYRHGAGRTIGRGPAILVWVDVYEDEHNFTLKIEVPGVEEKDIDVRIENNTLIVHGERKFEKEEREENYRRVERQYGSFTRSFTLPNSVDPGQVSAHYDKGVLKINLAKKAEAKPKQIKVNVGSEKTLEAKAPGKAA